MGREQEDHNARIARIRDQLSKLDTLTAETREEVLVAAEQLVEQALASSKEARASSRRARESRARERIERPARKRRR